MSLARLVITAVTVEGRSETTRSGPGCAGGAARLGQGSGVSLPPLSPPDLRQAAIVASANAWPYHEAHFRIR